MADNPESSLSWPLPPMQYIKNYTSENVKNSLAPPPPPPMVSMTYSMFGCPFHPHDTIIQSIESQNVKRLYPPNYDQKRELRKMNHSLLANFLDLLDVLVKSPDSDMRNEKIEDIRLLFINMHHLVNEYRAHQARETIRVLLSVQKNQRLEIADRFQRQLDRITDSLNQSLSSIQRPTPSFKFKTEPMETKEVTQSDVKSDDVRAVPDPRDQLMSQMLPNT